MFVAKTGRPEAELFKLDARKLRREDFFNAVMDSWGEAEKLPIEKSWLRSETSSCKLIEEFFWV